MKSQRRGAKQGQQKDARVSTLESKPRAAGRKIHLKSQFLCYFQSPACPRVEKDGVKAAPVGIRPHLLWAKCFGPATVCWNHTATGLATKGEELQGGGAVCYTVISSQSLKCPSEVLMRGTAGTNNWPVPGHQHVHTGPDPRFCFLQFLVPRVK